MSIPPGFGALNKRRQQRLLKLYAQMLVAPTTATAQIEDRITFLGPAQCMGW